jgi:hypothetical protein
MSGCEPEKAKDPGAAKSMRGQTAGVMTISSTFVTGADASLNMSGIDDLGGNDEVEIYAAQGAEPVGRLEGTNDQRGSYAPAPASFPTDLDGGAWTPSENYWVQVSSWDGSTWTTWQASVTPTASGETIPIRLRQRTF